MGDRAQVLIEDTGVYLYTHWGGSELCEDVARALKKRWRWDDPDYLTRIIFEEMVGDEFGTETGFGIGTVEVLDAWLQLRVDVERNQIEVCGWAEKERAYSFEEFIQEFGADEA